MKENIQLNRKVLAELSVHEPYSFKALVDVSCKPFPGNKNVVQASRKVDISSINAYFGPKGNDGKTETEVFTFTGEGGFAMISTHVWVRFGCNGAYASDDVSYVIGHRSWLAQTSDSIPCVPPLLWFDRTSLLLRLAIQVP